MSLVFWLLLAAAIMVFWALGAYNRIVRLRTAVGTALGELLAQWTTQAQAINERLNQYSSIQEAQSDWMPLGAGAVRWRALYLAGRQLLTCIRAMQTQSQSLPSAEDVSAVWAAYELFEASWQRLQAEKDDLAGAPIPPELRIAWAQHDGASASQRETYLSAVQAYHQAIGQFPASLIAWLFAFRPAQPPR